LCSDVNGIKGTFGTQFLDNSVLSVSALKPRRPNQKMHDGATIPLGVFGTTTAIRYEG